MLFSWTKIVMYLINYESILTMSLRAESERMRQGRRRKKNRRIFSTLDLQSHLSRRPSPWIYDYFPPPSSSEKSTTLINRDWSSWGWAGWGAILYYSRKVAVDVHLGCTIHPPSNSSPPSNTFGVNLHPFSGLYRPLQPGPGVYEKYF